MEENQEVSINQKPQCACSITNGQNCKFLEMRLSFSEPSICNFVELHPESRCSTQIKQWKEASRLFSESCKNETNSVVSDLLMIEAIWVGNGPAANAMENYRKILIEQGVENVASKYLFHVSQTWDDTISICKKGFKVPTEHKIGRHIIGKGIYAGQPKYVAHLTSDLGRGQRLNNDILSLNNPLTMLMCEVIQGKSCVYGKDKIIIDGSPLINGFNSHMSVGIPAHESCFFNANAIRPIFIIKVIRYKPELQKYLNPVLSRSTPFSFFKKDYESYLEKHRGDNAEVQQEYDKRFGLISS